MATLVTGATVGMAILIDLVADEVIVSAVTGPLAQIVVVAQELINSTFASGFAFGAGMIAVVNPCGFGMLPAWVGLYLASRKGKYQSPVRTVLHSFQVGFMITLGFICLFGISGLVIGVGFRSIIEWFPWLGFTVGLLLIYLASLMANGYLAYSSIPQRISGVIGSTNNRNITGYFVFGISYGIASLSCTLPIFLVVVATSLAASGIKESVTQFLWYALGMGFVIFILTLSLSAMNTLLINVSRRIQPWISWVSPVLLYSSGLYIIFYWITVGELF